VNEYWRVTSADSFVPKATVERAVAMIWILYCILVRGKGIQAINDQHLLSIFAYQVAVFVTQQTQQENLPLDIGGLLWKFLVPPPSNTSLLQSDLIFSGK